MLLPTTVRGTMTCLRPEFYHLSPAIGLALSAGGSHLLANLYGLQPKTLLANGARGMNLDGTPDIWKASGCGSLVREIFHRNHPDEPLRPTTNRSLAAAHLSPSITATVASLAASRDSGGSVAHATLRQAVCSDTGLTLPALAKHTGVTIARFERLVELVMAADDQVDAPLPHLGTSLLMRHMWLRATRVEELWTYLRSLHQQHSVLCNPDSAGPELFDATELSGPAVQRAAQALFARDEEAPWAFEVMAASLALGGSRVAPLNQARYGYRGQPAVADCAEMCAREICNILLWDQAAQCFDDSRLPADSSSSVRAFFSSGGAASCEQLRTALGSMNDRGNHSNRDDAGDVHDHEWHAGPPVYTRSAEAWFQLVSGLPDVPYLSGIPGSRYELAPTIDAVMRCLGVLFGKPHVRTPADLEALWASIQPARGLRFSANTAGDRLYVHEKSEGGEEYCTLELVMSVRLNHAFAIHKWRPPPWQREVAEVALQRWPTANRTGPNTCIGKARGSPNLKLALYPAVLQPVIATTAIGFARGDQNNVVVQSGRPQERERLRLLLMSTNPADDIAAAKILLALLDIAGEAEEHLAAGVLATTGNGLEGADDNLLIDIADAVASSRNVALRHAAALHPPLSAPVGLKCFVASAWQRAVLASPLRSLSLTFKTGWRIVCGGWQRREKNAYAHGA